MHGRLYCAVISSVILLVSLAVAQQASQAGTRMSDRDKAGLQGPVKSVLVEHNSSDADARRLLTSTRTEYAPDGRTFEVRNGYPDGSQW